MELKLKAGAGEQFVAFGGRGRVLLKDRSKEELVKLAIIGRKSQDRTILDLFEGDLPSLTDLVNSDTEFEKKQAEKNSLNQIHNTVKTGPAAVGQKPAGAGTQDTNAPK